MRIGSGWVETGRPFSRTQVWGASGKHPDGGWAGREADSLRERRPERQALTARKQKLEEIHGFCGVSKNFEGGVDLVAGVLAGHDAADAGLAFGHGGKGDAGGHETFFK